MTGTRSGCSLIKRVSPVMTGLHGILDVLTAEPAGRVTMIGPSTDSYELTEEGLWSLH
jgi:hypothetical protein